MINQVHALLHRPEKGWDPIPDQYAEKYAQYAWEGFDPHLIDKLEKRIGSLEGKRVLDLGGGPGQYSVAFAERGAKVIWHDISHNYKNIASKYAEEKGVSINFSIGYLENIQNLTDCSFDFVFNRVCWCYCMNDRKFARILYELVKPGGSCYIFTQSQPDLNASVATRLQYFLNNYLGWKIGHPWPPHSRVAKLFNAYPLERLIVDYHYPGRIAEVFFTKTKSYSI